MSYAAVTSISTPTAGLTLKAALTSAGTIHATVRDIATTEIGQGYYEWLYASMPDGYRGTAVFYTGTIGVASDFSGVVIYATTSVNPQEVENADVKSSTLSTYAGGDTSGTTTLLARLTNTRAGLIDNLDATISSRMATFSYTAPDNTSITAIKAKTDNLPADPADESLIEAAIATIPASLLDLDDGVEIGLTLRQALRGYAATLLGKSSNSGATFRDTPDTKDRVVSTVDATGNRTAVALDLS